MAKIRKASMSITVASDPVTPSLSIRSGITPPVQWKSEGEYSPDWSQTPLILTPELSLYDPDGVTGGTVPSFDTVQWEIFVDGVKQTDAQLTGKHTVNATTGELQWKGNLAEGETLSFRVTVTFAAGGRGYTASATFTARCEVTSIRVPRLYLDKPTTQKYNFVREEADAVITATLIAPGKVYVCDGSGNDDTCQFVWFRRNGAGKWTRIYPDTDSRRDIMDYDVMINADASAPADNSKLTVHRDMMGQKIDIMCRAIYYEGGKCYGGGITQTTSYDTDGTLIDGGDYADSPVAFYTTERFLRDTVVEMQQLRRTNSANSEAVYPVAYLADQMGEIEALEKHFNVKWKTASAWNGTATTTVAEGAKPVIPFSAVNGKSLTVEIEEKGSLKAITNNNKVLTYNGKIILTN